MSTLFPTSLIRQSVLLSRFSEDGNWYRAVIHSTTIVNGVDKYEVFFVDYGNRGTVGQEDLKSIHPRVLKVVPGVIMAEFK